MKPDCLLISDAVQPKTPCLPLRTRPLTHASHCGGGDSWVGPDSMRSSVGWLVDVAAIDRARILRGWTRRDLGRHARVDEGHSLRPFRWPPATDLRHSSCRLLGSWADAGRGD